MLLIDPPLWPAHGRLWSHLVSDTSIAELHDFADRLGIPRRAFEGDHYDVPEERYADCVALGATPTPAREVVRALQRSGLRKQKRKGEKVIHSYLEPHWLPAGSRADVIASTQDDPPAQTVVVRLAASWPDRSGDTRLLVTPSADGRANLPTEAVDGRPVAEVVGDLVRRWTESTERPHLRGYVRNVVPSPSPEYTWPAPRACFVVYALALPTPPRTGTSVTFAEASRELAGRHWWPLFAGGFG